MKIGSNEVGFLFNVRARINIAQMTGTKVISDVGTLFDGDEETTIKNLYKVAKVLNHEYELKKKQDAGVPVDPSENQAIIKLEDIYAMENTEFNELSEEVFATLRGERTVVAELKKKEKAKPSK